MTSKDLHSAISSRESAAGQSPSDSRCGVTIDLFGQVAAPVSRSARREKEKAKQTSATCGRCGSALSVNPDRQLCMESKCQPLSVMVGGMTWPMIWKEKVTPRGRKLGQLVVLASPTSGTDYGLWQTPQTRDFRSGGASRFENPDRSKNLNDMALWATPNTMDGMGDRSPEAMARQFSTTRKGRSSPANLREQVNPSMWPTPTSTNRNDDPAKRAERGKKYGFGVAWTLPMFASMWPTPNAPDDRDRGRWENPSIQRRVEMGKQINLSMIAQGCNGLPAQTEKQGQLNPQFVCWLMGYSTAHLSSMLSAMQSFRKSRRNSSKRQESK